MYERVDIRILLYIWRCMQPIIFHVISCHIRLNSNNNEAQ